MQQLTLIKATYRRQIPGCFSHPHDADRLVRNLENRSQGLFGKTSRIQSAIVNGTESNLHLEFDIVHATVELHTLEEFVSTVVAQSMGKVV